MKITRLALAAAHVAGFRDYTGSSSVCQTRPAFEDATLAWQKGANPPALNYRTQGWVDSSVAIPFEQGTNATYTKEDYARLVGAPGLKESAMVREYVAEHGSQIYQLLLTKLSLVWSGPKLVQRLSCPAKSLCRLSFKWEGGRWSAAPPLLPLTSPQDVMHIDWAATRTQFEYLFKGPSTRAFVYNTAFQSFEISYTLFPGSLCPSGQVLTRQATRSLSTATRHFGSVAVYEDAR